MLRRWLDPPAVRERKRLLRAMPRRRGETDFEIGCLWPLAALLAVAIIAGVFIVTRLQSGPQTPREAVVRVVDDSASPGPRIIGTAVVPLR